MRDIVAASIFRLIQIALVPIAAVGYVLWVVKIIKFSHESGASATVLASSIRGGCSTAWARGVTAARTTFFDAALERAPQGY